MFPIYDENRHLGKPYVNYGLLVINIAVFFYFLLQGNMESSFFSFGATPSKILRGDDLWTLVTSMFIHADIVHLFGNMIYLWVFGDNIEDALGHIKYLIFYLLGGFAASFIHIGSMVLTQPSQSLNIPSVGASGAISAVLGAYLLLYPRARIKTLVFLFFLVTIVSVPAFYYLGFWFLYQLMMGVFAGASSGVAFWAHIGGFVAGIAFIKILGGKAKSRIAIPQSTYPFRGRARIRPFVTQTKTRKPFVDAIVEGDRIRIFAKLAGIEEKDIRVNVSKVDAVISAQHGEIKYYTRVLLPATVIPEIKEFTFRNGVLTFFLPIRR